MTDTLTGAMRAVADARAEHVAAADTLKALRAAFDAEHAPLIADETEKRAAVAAAESAARALVLDAYTRTGAKAPVAGAEVKLFKTYLYENADALAWAKQTNMALVPESLDVKAFEKIAKATPLPFVRVHEEPKVTLATTLRATDYLAPVEVGQ